MAASARVLVEQDLRLTAVANDEAIAAASARLGWRVYVTKQGAEQLSMTQAVLAYRDEYLVERSLGRLKGQPLSLSPFYLTRDDPDPTIIQDLYLENLIGPNSRAASQGELRRYHIPLAGGNTGYEALSEEAFDLPRINYEQSNGRDYRFTYGSGRRKETPDDFLNAFVATDLTPRPETLHGAIHARMAL